MTAYAPSLPNAFGLGVVNLSAELDRTGVNNSATIELVLRLECETTQLQKHPGRFSKAQ